MGVTIKFVHAMVKGILFGMQFVALHAHYGLIRPTPWTNRGGSVPLVGVDAQCRAGFTGKGFQGTNCFWYQNWTKVPDDETLQITPEFYTFGNMFLTDRMPWTAPGTAPVDSPCGIDGGNIRGCWTGNGYGPGDPIYRKMKGVDNPEMNTNSQCFHGGYGQASDARNWQFQDVQTTYVNAGGHLLASWGLLVNHGGGYAYRLCRLTGDVTKETVTEECFRAGHLKFSNLTHSEVRHLYDSPVAIPAPIFSGATGPWRKNPIPSCKKWGSSYEKCEPLFEPPKEAPQMYGAAHSNPGDPGRDWQVMDNLEIDNRFPPGRYVLSFRMDAQQTPQIWFMCSDIEVLPSGSPLPSPPPRGESDDEEGREADAEEGREFEADLESEDGRVPEDDRVSEDDHEPEPESEGEGESEPVVEDDRVSEDNHEPEPESEGEGESEPVVVVCSREHYKKICPSESDFKPTNKIHFDDRSTTCHSVFEGEGGWVYGQNKCRRFDEECCGPEKDALLVSIDKHVHTSKFSGHMKDSLKEKVVVESDGQVLPW